MSITGYPYLDTLYHFPPTWAALVASFFVITTLSLSLFLLIQHLSAYKNPEEQKFLIGVILMVPCYAVESFVSLMNPSISVDCEILRDCYEAFAMYCFGRYLIACLGGEKNAIRFMKRQGRLGPTTPLLDHKSERGVVKHPFPMNCLLKPWRLGQWFYQVVKFGIVQYMIIKTLSALLAVFLQAFGLYCEGEFKLDCGYPYIAVVLNFSQSWALYCLVQFYAVTKDELAHIKPLAKFLMFKSIVFLTWWQGVAIAIFYALGFIQKSYSSRFAFQVKCSGLHYLHRGLKDDCSKELNLINDHCGVIIADVLSIIFPAFILGFSTPSEVAQMGIASISHLYVFPAEPYTLMGELHTGTISVLGDYASVDCPLDPDEVRDSERPTKLRLPQPDLDVKSRTAIRESVRDIVFGGGGYIVDDVKFTVTQAVEPVEKGFTRINERIHRISRNIKKHEKGKKTKDNSSTASSPTRRVIRGIDDPLLNGSISDSAVAKTRKHICRKSVYTSAESGGESSDQGYGGYEIRGRRWVVKD